MEPLYWWSRLSPTLRCLLNRRAGSRVWQSLAPRHSSLLHDQQLRVEKVIETPALETLINRILVLGIVLFDRSGASCETQRNQTEKTHFKTFQLCARTFLIFLVRPVAIPPMFIDLKYYRTIWHFHNSVVDKTWVSFCVATVKLSILKNIYC